MVELVVVACLLKTPAHCERFPIPFQAEVSVPQCVWQSQMHAAQWAGAHPDWQIKRISCEMPRT